MTERTKTGLEIIQAALLIGLFGNFMLRQMPWGLNAFMFVAVFIAGLLLLWRANRPELLNKTNLSLAGAMVFFASMFLFRDAAELLFFDTLAIIVLMGVMLLGSYDIRAHIGGAFHYVAGVMGAGLNSAFGGFVLLGADIDWKTMPGNSVSRNVFAVLRGLAIALPLLLIFGGLFVAADAVFAGWVNRAFNFEADVIISHVMITAFLAWLTAGYLRAAVIRAPTTSWGVSTPQTSVVPSSTDTTVRTGSGSDRQPAGSESPQPDTTDVTPQAETRPSGSVSTPATPDSSSYVTNFTSEQTEPENALPDNASILEHINKSDPPNAVEPSMRETSATEAVAKPATSDPRWWEDPLAGAAQDPDPARAKGETPATSARRDWQTLDNTALPSVFTLGTVETVIILGLVNLLFAGFVASQLPYLFGGMELVQNTPDFKLAEYARRGFGELVFVSALVLPMLLVSHWLIRRDGSRAMGLFRILAGVQIALLFVIMASAVQRLILLTGEVGYGLTTVRFYPMVLMVWLAVVFCWFAATVLMKNARNHFAWGALWSAVVILGATNLLNPHAFIASTNIQLMKQGRDFDAYYHVSDLSDDAIPVIIESLEHWNSDDALTAYYRLRYRACRKAETGEGDDPRSWNLSRSEADRTLASVGLPIPESKRCMYEWQGD